MLEKTPRQQQFKLCVFSCFHWFGELLLSGTFQPLGGAMFFRCRESPNANPPLKLQVCSWQSVFTVSGVQRWTRHRVFIDFCSQGLFGRGLLWDVSGVSCRVKSSLPTACFEPAGKQTLILQILLSVCLSLSVFVDQVYDHKIRGTSPKKGP